ncbi:hypothetical protein ABIE67_007852 [Streptomyces sp. V4I8]
MMLDALNHLNLGVAYLLVVACGGIGAGVGWLLSRRRR